MNRFYLLALMGATAAMPLAAQSKFDTGGRIALEQMRIYQANPAADLGSNDVVPFDLREMSRASARASVYVILAEGFTAADIEAQGLEIIIDGGHVVQAEGPLDRIIELEKCDFVKSLSFGQKHATKLDFARKGVMMDDVHNGTELIAGYKGKDVVAGIFDVGVDPNHANFCDANGKTRVGALWHFTGHSGKFKLYDTPEKIAEFKTDNSNESHGTHTTGCMTGSYNRRGGGYVAMTDERGFTVVGSRYTNPYYGMAPEATIAIGCGELYDANITAGIQEIINYAESIGKPAVVNLSIGSNIGPHDGSDATSQLISELGKRAIICFAAGNEGDKRMSVSKEFVSGDKSLQTFFGNGQGSANGYIEIWSSSSATFTTSLMIYDMEQKKVVYTYDIPGDTQKTYTIATSSEDTNGAITSAEFDRAFTRSSIIVSSSKNTATNNRYNVSISINLNPNSITNASGRYLFALKTTGTPGMKVQMTHSSSNSEFSNLGLSDFTDGSGSFSISSMACADNILCVGAWNTRKSLPCLGNNNNGATYSYNGWGYDTDSIAGYSSWGELADGRVLPHICAPGTGIISSISTPYYEKLVAQAPDIAMLISATQRYNDRNNYWEYMQGTSMATPIVAGAIATWLQADPTLTIDQVKDLVAKHAIKDKYVTGAHLPKQWGAGKFNAYGPIKELLAGGVNNIATDRDAQLIVEPLGADTWNVILGSDKTVNVSLYNVQGALVATASGTDGAAQLSTAGLASGIYVMNVNGTHSTRVAVK